jgi:hypothetical protein
MCQKDDARKEEGINRNAPEISMKMVRRRMVRE